MATVALLVTGRLGGFEISAAPIAVAIAIAIAGAAGGWWRDRPSPMDLARMVDRSLGGRERLTTAVEHLATDIGDRGCELWERQLADTEAWLAEVDPTAVDQERIPRRALAVVIVAALAVGALALAPDPGAERRRADQAAEDEREAVADAVGAAAAQFATGSPGEDSGRRQALVQELREVERGLREARRSSQAVAALSRAQARLSSLANPGAADRRAAAAGAGAALARGSAAANAATALSALADGDAQDLGLWAAARAGAGTEERGEAASQLRQAAGDTDQAEIAEALRAAADAVEQQRPADARRALDEATAKVEEARRAQAETAFDELAASLDTLDPAQREELAQLLEEASAAAGADPALADQLRGGAAALRDGVTDEAADALTQAGRRAAGVVADADLDADIATSASAFENIKAIFLDDLDDLDDEQGCATGEAGDVVNDGQPQGTAGEGEAGERSLVDLFAPSHEHPPGGPMAATHAGDHPGGACLTTSDPDPDPEGGAPGSQGQGSGQGAGTGDSGSGLGQGSGGAGSGRGGEGDQAGPPRGGGSVSGGAQGSLTEPPGRPQEQVYVPGAPAPGRTTSIGSGGEAEGTNGALLPYEAVYPTYRERALSESERQLVPEQLREVLRRYFGTT